MLAIVLSRTIQTKKPKDPYEHISLAVSGRPVLDGQNIVPRPTVTLLRDFDPCFDDLEEEDNLDRDHEEVDELYDQINEIAATQEVTVDSPPKVKPRTKFPVGSPKKINFGPPKPPRNFNYTSIKEDGEVPTKETKASQKSLKTMLSESNLVRALKKSEEKEVEEDPGLCKKQTDQPAVENIYVTIPRSSPPESQTPPPLPSSRPPAMSAERPLTLYENVWVEGHCLPPVPPRTESVSHSATKTGKLEEIFFSKKMSQESLVSHNSSGGGLVRFLTVNCSYFLCLGLV